VAGIDDVMGVWESSRVCVELRTTMECYDIGFCNAPGRNESSNHKRFSLLISVYSTLLLLEVDRPDITE